MQFLSNKLRIMFTFPTAKAAHLLRGEQSEQRASKYLLTQGLTEVARNFRCRYGELDLIMREQQYLVIVEVRYRQTDAFGSALESITARKQSRIITTTQHYLAKHPYAGPIRFDVVAISGDNHIQWIKNAFQT